MRGLTMVTGVIFLAVSVQCRKCQQWRKYGKAPPKSCVTPKDPQNRRKSKIEKWFSEKMFNDLFPKANLGWGPSLCRPYNYKAFIIAARYFPKFGGQYVTKDPVGNPIKSIYTAAETYKRDVAAFLSHAIQETGENDMNVYRLSPKKKADDCFYRGAFFNWFEGGPLSAFVKNKGLSPSDGKYCIANARYCNAGSDNPWFYPCSKDRKNKYYMGCYFGRGALQLSYNYNYGLFNQWLTRQGITHKGMPIDLLKNPNLVLTKTDPPLSIMASLWFYMTPQSPKPSMHDIVIGYWVSPDPHYAGAVFGPTSLVINMECGGEDKNNPGGPGESRRIKAFRWFTRYFKVPFNKGKAKTVSCKYFNGGKRSFAFPNSRKIKYSWDMDRSRFSNPKKPCQCIMQPYQGQIPAFDPRIMPHFAKENEHNRRWCERLYQAGYQNQGCSRVRNI